MQDLNIPCKGTELVASFKPLVRFPDGIVSDVFHTVVSTLKLHVMGKVHHHFKNGGETLIAVLAESHLAIEFWPSKRLIIFLASCRPFKAKDLIGAVEGRALIKVKCTVTKW